jgi:DNA mismatch endonuclease (patch repair protein)
MARVRSRNTDPEIKLRKALWSIGLRYRLASKLPGSPDIVFVRARVAVFVDGCFWHGCPTHYRAPKTNQDFWSRKLERNQNRDARVNTELAALGWHVVRVWEHEVHEKLEEVVSDIERVVRGG